MEVLRPAQNCERPYRCRSGSWHADGDLYAIQPEVPADRKHLQSDTDVVIEGAERLTPKQQVRVVKMDPAYLDELAQGFGA